MTRWRQVVSGVVGFFVTSDPEQIRAFKEKAMKEQGPTNLTFMGALGGVLGIAIVGGVLMGGAALIQALLGWWKSLDSGAQTSPTEIGRAWWMALVCWFWLLWRLKSIEDKVDQIANGAIRMDERLEGVAQGVLGRIAEEVDARRLREAEEKRLAATKEQEAQARQNRESGARMIEDFRRGPRLALAAYGVEDLEEVDRCWSGEPLQTGGGKRLMADSLEEAWRQSEARREAEASLLAAYGVDMEDAGRFWRGEPVQTDAGKRYAASHDERVKQRAADVAKGTWPPTRDTVTTYWSRELVEVARRELEASKPS